jgi:hypothetical protein
MLPTGLDLDPVAAFVLPDGIATRLPARDAGVIPLPFSASLNKSASSPKSAKSQAAEGRLL